MSLFGPYDISITTRHVMLFLSFEKDDEKLSGVRLNTNTARQHGGIYYWVAMGYPVLKWVWFFYWVAMGYPVLKWGSFFFFFFFFFTGLPWATQSKNGVGFFFFFFFFLSSPERNCNSCAILPV